MYSGQKLEIVEILAGANDMTIATSRPDGYPQATTVNDVNDGVTIYFGTGAETRFLRRFSRVARATSC